MATHSSVLAWRIPGTGEPGGLPSLGSQRVRHDWSDLPAPAAAAYINYFTTIKTWLSWLNNFHQVLIRQCFTNGMQQIHISCYVDTLLGFPAWFSGTEPACQCRRQGFDPGLGRIPEIATHSSIVAWEIPWTRSLAVHRAAKSWTWLSD